MKAALLLASGASVVVAAPAAALLPANITAATEVYSLESTSGPAQCTCWQDTNSLMLFYNRVPKCGSTTMVTMMDELAQEKGWYNGKQWEGFAFVQSQDFDVNHFDPDAPTRKAIVEGMMGRFSLQKRLGRHSGRTAFERHIHFIDFAETGEEAPVYINLLRDPSSLRASGFYFFRDCVCNQEPAHGDDFADEWCKGDWWRKSSAFCAETINSCYSTSEDVERCRSAGHDLGGSVLTDFICGAGSPECADPNDNVWNSKFAAKVNRAIDNMRNHYRWMGVLERLEDSLKLLQHQLPNFFGKIDAKQWGNSEIAPDGGTIAPRDSSEALPNSRTRATLLQDPYFQMEQHLYDHARALLGCKMQLCGVASSGVDAQRDLEVQADKSASLTLHHETEAARRGRK